MTNEMRAFIESLKHACSAMQDMLDIWDMLEGHEDDIVQNLSGWQNTFSGLLEDVPFSMFAVLSELEEKIERYN